MTFGGLIAIGIDYLALALIVGLLVLTQKFGFGVGSAFDILTVFLVLCIVALWICGGRLHWRRGLDKDAQIMPEHLDDHAPLRH